MALSRWRLLLPLYLGAAMGPLGGSAMMALLPTLREFFGVPIGLIAWSITVYMIPFSLAQFLTGSLAQVISGRRTALLGFSVFSLASLICAAAPEVWSFLGARLIQGLGAAFLFPILMALIGEVVDAPGLGRAMGILGVVQTVALTVGPLLAGYLEETVGWRWFFLVLGLMGIGVCGAFSRLFSPERERQESGGSGLFGVVGQVVSRAPVRALSLAGFTLFFSFIGVLTFTAAALKEAHGLREDQIGILLAVFGGIGIPMSPLGGILADRVGRRETALVGLTGYLISLGALWVVPYSFGGTLLLLACMGSGNAVAWVAYNTLSVELVPALRKPVTSVYNSVRFFGYAVAPALLSPVYTGFSLGTVYALCAMAGLASMALVLRLPPEGRSVKRHGRI